MSSIVPSLGRVAVAGLAFGAALTVGDAAKDAMSEPGRHPLPRNVILGAASIGTALLMGTVAARSLSSVVPASITRAGVFPLIGVGVAAAMIGMSPIFVDH